MFSILENIATVRCFDTPPLLSLTHIGRLFACDKTLRCPHRSLQARAVLRIDSVLRSALGYHFDGHAARSPRTPATLPSRRASALCPSPTTTIPKRLLDDATKPVVGMGPAANRPDGISPDTLLTPSVPPTGSASRAALPSGGGRGDWLLWGLYAKFAERCLNDPRVALHALDRAVVAAAIPSPGRYRRDRGGRGPRCSSSGGSDAERLSGNDSRCGGFAYSSLALVARAHFCQRWPKLREGVARSSPGSHDLGALSTEKILMDATQRCDNVVQTCR